MAFDILSFVMGQQTAKGSGGSGGGGGELPGVYWTVDAVPFKNNFYQKWFKLNGEQYCVTLPYAGNGNEWIIYKYSNNVWTEIVPETLVFVLNDRTLVIEYEGEIHFIAHDVSSSNHWIFNGATLTRKTDIQGKPTGACIHQNELCVALFDGTVHKWNKDSDSWEQVANLGMTNKYFELCLVSGELYANYYTFPNQVLLKIENEAVTEIATFVKGKNIFTVRNKTIIYFAEPIYRGAWEVMAYNTETGEDILLGYAPQNISHASIEMGFTDDVRLLINNDGANSTLLVSLIPHFTTL